jgi:hypothetical protein
MTETTGEEPVDTQFHSVMRLQMPRYLKAIWVLLLVLLYVQFFAVAATRRYLSGYYLDAHHFILSITGVIILAIVVVFVHLLRKDVRFMGAAALIYTINNLIEVTVLYGLYGTGFRLRQLVPNAIDVVTIGLLFFVWLRARRLPMRPVQIIPAVRKE